MNSSTRKFINYVKAECKKHGVKVKISNRKYLIIPEENNVRVNGYFCSDSKVLRVASNKPFKKWFPIFVHEFCHFLQWKENCKIWRDSFSDGNLGYLDASDAVFKWIDGERMSSKKIDKCIVLARNVELDCERRVCKLIKEFNLPLNLDEYAQQANTYVYLYNWLKYSRRWYKTGNAPYENPKIWKSMPKTLKGSHNKIPKYILELYNRYC